MSRVTYEKYKWVELRAKGVLYDYLIRKVPNALNNCRCANDLGPRHINDNKNHIKQYILDKSKKMFHLAIIFRLEYTKRKNIKLDKGHKKAIDFLSRMVEACDVKKV